MEMEEMNLEEIFDFGPTLSEIYTSQLQPQTGSYHASGKANNIKDQLIISSSKSWNSCYPQEIINCTKPSSCSSSSSSSAVAAASVAQLISFENLNTSSLPTNSDTVLGMAKDYNSLTPQIINFSFSGNDIDSEDYEQYHDGVINGTSQKRVCSASRTPLQAQDHLVAERKRREKLGQLFISLSKVVPGLKKLDKASLLEDAIKYLKDLQERVSVLEEEEIMIKKSSMEEESSINYDNLGSNIINQTGTAPEIKARISNRNVLIKICCKKEIGLMSRIPSEMERMHLSVVDMRFMPFGGTALDITILAEMHNEFRGTVKDIADHLQMVFAEPASGH